MRVNVDFPEPEPPITARHSPAWTSTETSKRTWWRAARGPKDLVMEWAERSGTLLLLMRILLGSVEGEGLGGGDQALGLWCGRRGEQIGGGP